MVCSFCSIWGDSNSVVQGVRVGGRIHAAARNVYSNIPNPSTSVTTAHSKMGVLHCRARFSAGPRIQENGNCTQDPWHHFPASLAQISVLEEIDKAFWLRMVIIWSPARGAPRSE